MSLEIRTARLVLRNAEPDDLEDMFAVFGDGRAMRYWSSPPHPDRQTTQARIDRMRAAFAERPCQFVIEHAGRVIGTLGMAEINEVGFILHPDHWRKGFITEAMAALLPQLWQWTTADHLMADVDPGNAASIGLLTSLGFVETHREARTFFINGIWTDSVFFALSRPGSAEAPA